MRKISVHSILTLPAWHSYIPVTLLALTELEC